MTTNKSINQQTCFNSQVTNKTVFLTLLLSLAISSQSHVCASDFDGSLKGVTITDTTNTNAPPTAVINYTQDGDTVNFDASGSFDSDGSITEYRWDFGDETTGSGTAVIHQFAPGSFPVTLTLVDNKGGIALKHIAITTISPVWVVSDGVVNCSILYVDSEEQAREDGSATNVFDSDPETMWVTEWSVSTSIYPHEIQIDLGKSLDIDGLRYLPRQVGNLNGTISQFELYITDDLDHWNSPAVTGTFAADASLKEISFSKKKGRYIRFIALSEINGNPWASAAELDFHGQ